MNTALLLGFALINVVVTASFALVVLRQYLRRHKAYQLYWSLALSMAFLATLAYVCMLFVQPTSNAGSLLFRVYYILGAALTSAWLGLGSLALVARPNLTRLCLLLLCFVSLLAIFFIAQAPINLHLLSQVAGTSGRGVLELGAAGIGTIAILNALGVVAVVAVAIYSGWQLMQRQASIGGLHTSNLFWANLLILVGETLNALAGTLARLFSLDSTFWLFMALGWIVFFAGVLLTSRRSALLKRAAPTSTPEALASEAPTRS